jgi:(p)ppGpp synthase/HD superfamily hydrolase
VVRDRFGFDDPRMLITALLHDTIEDTTTDFDDLAERFGNEIAQWVAYLSKDKRLQEDEREQAYIAGLKKAPWQVQICKLADLYDNLTDLPRQPADKQARSLKRYEQYFEELRPSAAPEAQKPIALVQALLDEVRRSTQPVSGG